MPEAIPLVDDPGVGGRGPGQLMELLPESDTPSGIDGEVAHGFPEHLAQRFCCIPIGVRGNTMVLGMRDPLDVIAADDVRLITGFDVEPFGLSEEAIRAALETGDCRRIVEELPGDLLAIFAPLRPSRARRVAGGTPFPLQSLDVQAVISGPLASVRVRQAFANPREEAVEAVYVFPLPEGAAVHGFRMRVADRVVEGDIRARQEARRTYEQGKREGYRAALIEQDRDNVFTVTVGNLPPGETVTIELEYAERLPADAARTTFRFPLVVAPRYVPGAPLDRPSLGAGTESDTDQVPDASRVSPPLLVPGLRGASLSLAVRVETGGAIPATLACSQHATVVSGADGGLDVTLAREDELLDRDFVLHVRLAGDQPVATLLASGAHFLLSVWPPSLTSSRPAMARDVVFLLDRSGSMRGSKMRSARRAVAGFLDSLRGGDRFALVAFDDRVECFGGGDVSFHAVDEVGAARAWLDRIDSRGGTEIAGPMRRVLALPGTPERLLCTVLVTDGEVSNEADIFEMVVRGSSASRIFTLGIDTAVNDAFLRQLARLGRGTCELVTTGEGLESALGRLAREVGRPLVTDLELVDRGLAFAPDSFGLVPDLYEARPIHVMGCKRGTGRLEVRGRLADDGRAWIAAVEPVISSNPALPILWARDRVRALEDRIRLDPPSRQAVEAEIVALALEHRLLTRFTSFVLVDRSEVVSAGGDGETVMQPVHAPADWTFGGFGASDPAEACETMKDLSACDFGPLESDDEEPAMELDRLRELVDEAPIVRVVNLILRQAFNDRATHVHIELEPAGVRVRYRVDGVLHDVMSPPRHIHAAVVMRLKMMAGLDVAERRSLQTGRMHLVHDGVDREVTVSICPTAHQDRVVLELLDPAVFSLEKLSLVDELRPVFDGGRGWVVVAGTRDSGRSVTMAACLSHLSGGSRSMVAHDRGLPPIPGVAPLVGPPEDAVAAMRRQDADVLMVGRTGDDARSLAEAAVEGRLVLSGLDAADVVEAIVRLIAMTGDAVLVASALSAVVSQRLLRMSCGSCAGAGCDRCKMTGYHGRIGVYAVVKVTPRLRDVIAQGPSREALREAIGAEALLARAAALVRAGVTTEAEVSRVIGSAGPG